MYIHTYDIDIGPTQNSLPDPEFLAVFPLTLRSIKRANTR
jgi:hypothetical protein